MLHIFLIYNLMLVKVGIHESTPEDIKLQLSMKILNVGITREGVLIYCPPGAVLCHREPPLGIGPSRDVNRKI